MYNFVLVNGMMKILGFGVNILTQAKVNLGNLSMHMLTMEGPRVPKGDQNKLSLTYL